MLGSETLVYAGNARQKVGEVTSYFRTPGISLLDWQNNSDCGRAGRAGGHNPPPFGLGAEPANTGTSPLPVGCSHIHPKTACREVRERQWHSAAPVSAPASASAGRFPLGSGTRGSRRDQVLLSLPQNRRKHGFSPVSFLLPSGLTKPLVLPGVNKEALANIFWEAHADKNRGAKVPCPAKGRGDFCEGYSTYRN